VVVLIAVLIGVPGSVRVLQRRRRLAEGTAGALWDELGATALDAGVGLHPSWTPRQAARALTGVLTRPGGAPDQAAADAVQRLALAEEAASYGPAPGAEPPGLPAALRAARRGLLRAVPWRTRLRARLWPASLVTGAGTRLAAAVRRLVPTSLHRRRRSPRTA
jgi:hypothetical protein